MPMIGVHELTWHGRPLGPPQPDGAMYSQPIYDMSALRHDRLYNAFISLSEYHGNRLGTIQLEVNQQEPKKAIVLTRNLHVAILCKHDSVSRELAEIERLRARENRRLREEQARASAPPVAPPPPRQPGLTTRQRIVDVLSGWFTYPLAGETPRTGSPPPQ